MFVSYGVLARVYMYLLAHIFPTSAKNFAHASEEWPVDLHMSLKQVTVTAN
jgi:hypothetical protein